MHQSRFLAGAVAPCILLASPAGAQTHQTSAPSAPVRTASAQASASDIVVTATPTVAQATAEIERTPGGVEVVPDTAFKTTPVQTIKDVLQYVPGVIVQPRMGDDVRLSIRGSGPSRAYGVRGITLTIDGIPMNTSHERTADCRMSSSAAERLKLGLPNRRHALGTVFSRAPIGP